MINFLFKKILRNKLLMFCLILGNILLVGVALSNSLYITASTQRVFEQNMRAIQYEKNRFPAVMSLRLDAEKVDNPLDVYNTTMNSTWPMIINDFGVGIERQFNTYIFQNVKLETSIQREEPPMLRRSELAGITDFENYINITHGRLPADSFVDNNIIEVVAPHSTLIDRNLLLNETFFILDATNRRTPYRVQIVGIFELLPDSGALWSEARINLRQTLIMSEHVAFDFFIGNDTYPLVKTWTAILDYTSVSILKTEQYQETLTRWREHFDGDEWIFSNNFFHALNVEGTESLTETIWVLTFPMFLMLAIFIYMISSQVLQIDRNEISVLVSRGASRWQVIFLYILQGLFIAVISFPIGFFLGIGLCQFIGASNGFMNLVQRETVRILITSQPLLLGGVALLFSFLTMFLPVIGFSKIGILEHKTKSKKSLKPFWQRYFIDVIIFGVAIYSYINITQWQDFFAIQAAEGRGMDPVMFLTSSLFIIGFALLCIRIFPFIIMLIFKIGQSFWPPSIYTSMIKFARSSHEVQYIMLFLILSVSIGILSAQTARTLNLNNDHMVQYMSGSDLRFRERWFNNIPTGGGLDRVIMETGVEYFEPDFSRYTNFEEVDTITQVTPLRADIFATGFSSVPINLMGIDTRSFGKTVWFRDDLLQIHLNYYLNILGQTPNGVLLSDNFRTEHNFQIGQTIRLREIAPSYWFDELEAGAITDFIVVGFIEHFPGFAPVTRYQLPTGEFTQHYDFLAVANTGFLRMHWGMRPYEIWMSTNTETNQFFHDFINNAPSHDRIILTRMQDAKSDLIKARNDPIFQGTNGVLTISFLTILLVCIFGFLIYWTLSIKSRVFQFGIFRAMGMRMRSILNLLFVEQILTTFVALGLGVLIGEISSRLFVPLIKISYTAADQVIPLLLVMEARDYVGIYTVLGTMIVICLIILGSFISKLNIYQALKLGED